MAKFRKKPVEIEAVRWDGEAHTANSFLGDRYGTDWEYAGPGEGALLIPTLEGKMRAEVGDMIIRGVKGEFYPCKPDIFEATYEAVAEHAPLAKVAVTVSGPAGASLALDNDTLQRAAARLRATQPRSCRFLESAPECCADLTCTGEDSIREDGHHIHCQAVAPAEAT